MAETLLSAIRHPLSVLFVVALLLRPALLHAQSVRGTLRDQTSSAIISEALVQLIAEREKVVASGTSSARGEYLLRAPTDGVYRLRVSRIGFRPWTSDTVRLNAAALVVRDLAVDAGVVVLAELAVTARSACKRSPADDARMETVWQQARTTLGLIDARHDRELVFRVRLHDRTLNPREEQLQETTSHTFGRGAWPVMSLPAESLAARGFIQPGDALGPVYYGPDVAVFFSDVFLASHCFRLLPAPQGESDLIGLGFEPLPGRGVADIEGVLWLHRRDGLSRLEYRYAPMPSWVPKGRAGGVLKFDRLPTGRPIITHWSLQAPIPRIERSRTELHGFKQTVGEVEQIREGREVVWSRTPS